MKKIMAKTLALVLITCISSLIDFDMPTLFITSAFSEVVSQEEVTNDMANITKIVVDSVEYSVKDATLDAVVNGSSGSTEDVTSSAEWTSAHGVDYRTGLPISESGYSYTDIALGEAVHVSGYTRAGQELTKGLAFLTSNGTYISGDANLNSGTYDWNYSFDIPDGAAILRISCNTNYTASFTCTLTYGGTSGLVDEVEDIQNSIEGVLTGTDTALSTSGMAADAKVTGDAIRGIIGDTAWLNVSNFEVGTLYLDGTAIATASNSTRIRTKTDSQIYLSAGDTVGLSSFSHYRIIFFYSADGTSWTQGSWMTANYTIPNDGYYLFLVEDTNGTTQSTPDALFALIKYVDASAYSTEIENRLSFLENAKSSAKFAHLSFDDVQYCMLDLQTNEDTYTSIFENPFFAMLKTLHETYGTVVSLYLFITNSGTGIAGYPTKFADEFADNAHWLKFGLHQGSTNYESTTAEQALSDYDTFTSNIVSIGGTVDIIDRCPRLGNFKGNSDSVLAMRDADAGIVGLLSAYDDRDSYCLSSADSAYVFEHGRLYDTTTRLTFFRSLYAMEAQDPTSFLPSLRTLSGVNGSDYAILMMHEYGVYGSDYTINSSMQTRLEYACNWAMQNGYAWDFPMNRIIQ